MTRSTLLAFGAALTVCVGACGEAPPFARPIPTVEPSGPPPGSTTDVAVTSASAAPPAAPTQPDRAPALPPFDFSGAKTVELAGASISATVCKIDPGGTPLVADSLTGAVRAATLDTSGRVYLLDPANKLRRYRVAATESCTLERDDTFGKDGALSLDPKGTHSIEAVARNKTGVFVSGDFVRRIEPGGYHKLCTDLFLSQIHVSPALPHGYGDNIDGLQTFDLDGDGCRPRSAVRLQGAAKGARLIGLAGDVLVAQGETPKGDDYIRTFHTSDGKLLGRAKPDKDGRIGVSNAVSSCGSRICVAVTGLLTSHDIWIWSRKGDFVGRVDMRDLTGAALYPTALAEHDGELWVFGGIRKGSGDPFHVAIARVRGLSK